MKYEYARIDREGSFRPAGSLQREVYDFARFLRAKKTKFTSNGLLLSESASPRIGNTPEEYPITGSATRSPFETGLQAGKTDTMSPPQFGILSGIPILGEGGFTQ